MLKVITFLVFLYSHQVTSDLINSGNCRILNREWNEYLYPVAGANYDRKRRHIFTWIPGGCDDQCNFELKAIGTTVEHKYRLKSLHFDEYLYAGPNDMKYDNRRRNVFSWIPGGACDDDECYWLIQQLGDGEYFTIKNFAYNEYLYAADGMNYDDRRRRVFTWRENHDVANDKASHWAINCR